MATYTIIYDSRRWVRSDSTDVTVVLPVVAGGTGTTTATGTAGSVVLSISPTLTGTPLAPTAAAATSTTQIATTAFVWSTYTSSGTISNKTIDNTNTITVKDANFTLQDDGGVTRQAQFQLSGITAGNTRTLTIQDTSYTIAGRNITETATAVGIGATPSARLDVSGAIRSSAATTLPSTGAGVEIVYSSPNGGVTAFDRDAAAFKPLYVSGSTITLTRAGIATAGDFSIDASGNVFTHSTGAALATNAVDGFTNIPNCAGTPTGVPGHPMTGATPIVYDTSGNKLWSYNAGWQSAAGSSTPDIALSLLAPAVDETITAGYSAVVERSYTIASGKKLTIGSGARFRIL